MRKTYVVLIEHADDENIACYLNGEYVGSANHDEDGWAGMHTLESTMRKVAGILKAKIEVV